MPARRTVKRLTIAELAAYAEDLDDDTRAWLRELLLEAGRRDLDGLVRALLRLVPR